MNDVHIANAETVGDFRVVLMRIEGRLDALEHDVAMNASGSEQQLAALRHELRGVQVGGVNNKFDLVDTKTMTPAVFTGARSESFTTWAKRVKAYTNARLPGYRRALDEVDKLGKDCPVDEQVLTSWDWRDVVQADSKLHDFLLMATAGEALGVVESVAGRGFEAWRLLNVRFNAIGELYTVDKMNSIMHQKAVRHISEMPAAISKFEKDLKVFRERVGSDFPEILKLPILMQMIPQSWKKEFDSQFRNPTAVKSYEALSAQLIGIGSEERYKRRKGRGRHGRGCPGEAEGS